MGKDRGSRRLGLDLVGIQDHPYQRRFLDTWTLLSYLAAGTERIACCPTSPTCRCGRRPCSPSRPPGWTCSAAGGSSWGSAPERSGRGSRPWAGPALAGRVGRRAGGGDRGDPRDLGRRGRCTSGVRTTGAGAKPGPAPAHPIGIWLGAYGPRMLRLTGRPATAGCRASAPTTSTRTRRGAQAAVDEGAEQAGRDPAEIERAVNVMALDDPTRARSTPSGSRGSRPSFASRPRSSASPPRSRSSSSAASARTTAPRARELRAGEQSAEIQPFQNLHPARTLRAPEPVTPTDGGFTRAECWGWTGS